MADNSQALQLLANEGRDKGLSNYIDKFIVDNIVRPPNKKKYLKELNEQHSGKLSGQNKLFVGMPITMERSDVKDVLSKNKEGNYKYSLTQKVDGERMVMFIGGGQDGSREVVFISRSWKYYRVFNENGESLISLYPSVPNVPEMLIDGEMVFFDSSGDSHKHLEARDTKAISFMAFDMLYGPNDISRLTGLEGNRLQLGQSSSMVIPESGESPVSPPWTYVNRYSILHKLIVPNEELNNNRAFITEAFLKVTKWFMIEIKPIYFLDQVKGWTSIYLDSGGGVSQKRLTKYRRDFYESVGAPSIFTQKVLKLDGLIFTAADTLYTSGNWNLPGTAQFKWKPANEQTIDFSIVQLDGQNVSLIIRGKGFFPPREFGLTQVAAVSIMPVPYTNREIGEFAVSLDGNSIKYKFAGFRKDKTESNAYRTALSVLKSVVGPININVLLGFLNMDDSLDERKLKELLKYSNKKELIKCSAMAKGWLFVPEKQQQIIKESIAQYQGNDFELEFRLGKITPTFFNANLKFEQGRNAITVMDSKGWTSQKSEYVDLVEKDGIRARYELMPRLGYIRKENIKKTRKSDLNIKLVDNSGTQMFPYDIRFSVSQEERVLNKFLTNKSNFKVIKKDRVSYTHPKGIFVVDVTKITFGGKYDIEKREYTKSEESSTWQVELEVKEKNPTILTEILQLLQELSDKI